MHVAVTFPAVGLSINSVSIVTVGRVNALMPLASYTWTTRAIEALLPILL
jgi:hypothetical protein